jgi:hypothetical protein
VVINTGKYRQPIALKVASDFAAVLFVVSPREVVVIRPCHMLLPLDTVVSQVEDRNILTTICSVKAQD